jgi:hypothetical protein
MNNQKQWENPYLQNDFFKPPALTWGQGKSGTGKFGNWGTSFNYPGSKAINNTWDLPVAKPNYSPIKQNPMVSNPYVTESQKMNPGQRLRSNVNTPNVGGVQSYIQGRKKQPEPLTLSQLITGNAIKLEDILGNPNLPQNVKEFYAGQILGIDNSSTSSVPNVPSTTYGIGPNNTPWTVPQNKGVTTLPPTQQPSLWDYITYGIAPNGNLPSFHENILDQTDRNGNAIFPNIAKNWHEQPGGYWTNTTADPNVPRTTGNISYDGQGNMTVGSRHQDGSIWNGQNWIPPKNTNNTTVASSPVSNSASNSASNSNSSIQTLLNDSNVSMAVKQAALAAMLGIN